MDTLPVARPPAEDDMLIKEGDWVVFDEHGDRKALVVIKRNGRAKVGKSHINTGDLIGARWGSTYTLSAGSTSLSAITEHEPVSGPAIEAVEKDNRDLVDLNTSQALTTEDIEAMKASGRGGDEIVEALCKHSTTFEGKTEFAQEKYKRRKARKYLTRLTLRKPTGWTVCQVMFDKSPNAVWNLRPDSLALLLSLANVGAGARCLVLENCQGLVSGAVAERLGGVGALCCLGTGSKPAPISVLGQMNLAPAHKAVVSATQLADLLAAAQRRSSGQSAANGEEQQQQQQQQQQGLEQPAQQPAQQLEQPAANGSNAQQPATAAAGGSCAAEAAAEAAGSTLLSRSIPGVAAAAAPAVAAAAATAGAAGEGQAAPAAAVGPGHDDELDELYDSSAAAAAGGADKKRRRSSGSTQQAEGSTEAAGQQQKRQKQQQQQQGNGEAADTADTEMPDADAAAAAAGGKGPSKEGRVQHLNSPEAVDQLLAGGFNSCIIAAPKLQPTAMLQQLLPLLAPSSPFVVFSPWVQPLAEAMAALTASRSAVMLQLQESWLRPYQVLPGRTHPHMALTTGGTGGYILSGITTVPDTRPQGAAEEQREQRQGRGRGRGGRGRGNSKRR